MMKATCFFSRFNRIRLFLGVLTMGLFELFGASASHAGPALGPVDKFFDP